MQRLERDFHFFVPVDVAKSATLNEEGDWVFEGIASTSNMDLFGDVVYPASFEKSIEFFKQNGKIFYNHNYARKMATELMEAQTPIGVPIDGELTDDGLYIKAVLNKQHPLAQKIWKENLSNPDPRFNNIGLSIGAKALGPTERKYSDVHKRYVSVLPDLLLYEVSMTATPVNPETKTWVSKNSFAQVMKSMIEEDENNDSSTTEIMQVTPDEVLYDGKNNVVVVKSSVQAEDGTKYVFEQTFNAEDIRKSMEEKDKKPQDATQAPQGDEQQAAPTDNAPDASAAEQKPEAGVEQGGAPEGGAPEGGNPFGEGGDEGQDPAQQDGAAPGAPGMEGGEAGGTPLDSLFGGAEGGGAPGEPGADGQPGAEPQEDASMALLLDKVDTLVEVMTTIAQDIAADKQSQNPGVEVTETPPTPANDDVLKSINEVKVELSNFSRDNLSTIIKSVVTEVITEVVRNELAAIVAQGVLKSADKNEAPKTVVIRQPAVEVAAIVHEDGSKTVLKSFAGNDLDLTVLKSFITEYTSIRGSNASHSSKRANVLYRVEETLGIPQHEFHLYVRKFEKGTLE